VLALPDTCLSIRARKIQVPSSREAASPKLQIAPVMAIYVEVRFRRFREPDLEFGVLCIFAAWNLIFSASLDVGWWKLWFYPFRIEMVFPCSLPLYH
jgi:hypothetical protein